MPGHAAATIEPMQIQKRRRGGYRGGFGSYDPTILWLSHGTNGRRTKKNLRLRDEATRRMLRETKEGRGTGLRARPFMRRALVTVALPTAIATMRQNGSGRLG